MLGRMHDLLGVLQIDIWMLKQPQAEFKLQNTPYRAINQCHGNSAFLHTLNHRSHVSRFVRNVQIDARAERKSSCFVLRADNALVEKSPKSLPLAATDSFESQLLPYHIAHPLPGPVGRNVLTIWITGHHT